MGARLQVISTAENLEDAGREYTLREFDELGDDTGRGRGRLDDERVAREEPLADLRDGQG